MQEFKEFSNGDIDQRLSRLVKSERKITHLVLQHIAEVHRRRIFLDFGYASTFEYLTARHGYCESSAYRRLQAAQVFMRDPEVGAKLENGKINLTQMSKVEQCLKQQVKAGKKMLDAIQIGAVIEALEDKSLLETSRILSRRATSASCWYILRRSL